MTRLYSFFAGLSPPFSAAGVPGADQYPGVEFAGHKAIL
jgi:hypothetical protein